MACPENQHCANCIGTLFDPYVIRPNHCAKHKMQTTAAHVAWSVCLSVCLVVTIAKWMNRSRCRSGREAWTRDAQGTVCWFGDARSVCQ